MTAHVSRHFLYAGGLRGLQASKVVALRWKTGLCLSSSSCSYPGEKPSLLSSQAWFVCLLIWYLNPCTDLDEILHAHPHLSKKGFGEVLTPTPTPWRPIWFSIRWHSLKGVRVSGRSQANPDQIKAVLKPKGWECLAGHKPTRNNIRCPRSASRNENHVSSFF